MMDGGRLTMLRLRQCEVIYALSCKKNVNKIRENAKDYLWIVI